MSKLGGDRRIRSMAGKECGIGFQLDLRAADVVEVAGVAGGWIFDRVRAGWVVTVWLPEHVDTRAMAILGADVRTWADAEGTAKAPR